VQAVDSQALAPRAVASHPNGVHRIQPSRWLVPVDFAELWRYRELVRFFVLRDVKSRYRQTYLGPAWALLRPLMTMVIFSAIFGGLAGISPGTDIPYPLWVTPAVLAFGYVSTALTNTSTSLVANSNLITKVYFPRLYVPLSTALTPVVDFLIGLFVLLGLFLYYHRAPSWHIVFLPAFFALAALVVVGVGLWIASFTARYRDAVFGVPFLVQIWQYATPVIYPVSFIPPAYRWLLDVNPFTAVVAGFRWSLLGVPFGSMAALAASISIAVGITVSGLFVFRRTERIMVDML
jgi:lipopolysaccharide transport system permease protein